MEYRLLENADAIRRQFMDAFVLSYEDFRAAHARWISGLRMEFDEAYYAKMYMWDRLAPGSRVIPFAEALNRLRAREGEVLFLTEAPACVAQDFCQLNKDKEYVAAASAVELAEWASYEWYTEYELAEQGCCLADPVLPAEMYVFNESYAWCLILTHETGWDESPDSRVCLWVERESDIVIST